MAKHQWSILCRRSIIDRDDNSISLIDALEGVTILGTFTKEEIEKELIEKSKSIKGAPSTGIQLVSLWIRTGRDKPETDYARAQVKSPNGKILINTEYKIDLNTSIRSRQKIQFPAIPFDGTGIYHYITQQRKGTEIKPRWTTVSELYFDLKQIGENPPMEKITF